MSRVKAIDAVLSGAWAIQPEALDVVASIAERESEYHGRPEALEAKLGRPLGNTMSVTVRDGVATIPFEGPMFRRANLMTMFSGATSYDMLARDFTAALEDPNVKAIIGYFDTPGGEITGCAELAAMISEARGKKPLIAYAGGSLCSAGIWLGSAFDRVIAAPTAMVGCLGVQMGYTVREPRAGEKTYRFVSSQTPLKNADPATEEGAAETKRTVDSLAQVFIDALAEYRGTTSENVLENYGKGAVFVAADALERGMIDGISTYETVLNNLSKPERKAMDLSKLTAAELAESRPDLVASIREAAVAEIKQPDVAAEREAAATAERTRISEIMAAADGIAGAEAIVAAAIADPAKTSASVAVDLLKHVKLGAASKPANPGAAHMSALKDAEKCTTQPTAGADADKPTDLEKGRADIEALRKQGLIA